MPRKHIQRNSVNDRHISTKKSCQEHHWATYFSLACLRTYSYILASHRGKSRPTQHQTSRPTHSHVKHEIGLKSYDDGDGTDSDGSLFEWEEEATLLSDLMEEGYR